MAPQYRSNLAGLIREINQLKLEDKHENELRKTPFWFLINGIIRNRLTFNQTKKSDKILLEVINSYNKGTTKFNIGGRQFKITKKDIKLTFGIEDGYLEINSNQKGKKLYLHSKFVQRVFPKRLQTTKKYDLTRPEILAALQTAMKRKEKTAAQDVARLIVLLSIATVFVPPHAQKIPWAYCKYVEDLKTIRQYDWTAHIFQELQKNLAKHDRNKITVAGCMIQVLYSLCEHMGIIKPVGKNNIPRCENWDLSILPQELSPEVLSSINNKKVIEGSLKETINELKLLGPFDDDDDSDDNEGDGDDDDSDDNEGDGDNDNDDDSDDNKGDGDDDEGDNNEGDADSNGDNDNGDDNEADDDSAGDVDSHGAGAVSEDEETMKTGESPQQQEASRVDTTHQEEEIDAATQGEETEQAVADSTCQEAEPSAKSTHSDGAPHNEGPHDEGPHSDAAPQGEEKTEAVADAVADAECQEAEPSANSTHSDGAPNDEQTDHMECLLHFVELDNTINQLRRQLMQAKTEAATYKAELEKLKSDKENLPLDNEPSPTKKRKQSPLNTPENKIGSMYKRVKNKERKKNRNPEYTYSGAMQKRAKKMPPAKPNRKSARLAEAFKQQKQQTGPEEHIDLSDSYEVDSPDAKDMPHEKVASAVSKEVTTGKADSSKVLPKRKKKLAARKIIMKEQSTSPKEKLTVVDRMEESLRIKYEMMKHSCPNK